MVIGLDIDDTITRHPVFFAFLSRALIDAGHQVVIITFRACRESADADLRAWGVACSQLVLGTPDEVMAAGVDQWKSSVCERLGVEVFFDDDPTVLRHVDPRVACFMAIGEPRTAFV